jgi:hypothetical protein
MTSLSIHLLPFVIFIDTSASTFILITQTSIIVLYHFYVSMASRISSTGNGMNGKPNLIPNVSFLIQT